MKFEGFEKCAWLVGRENAEREGLNGDCKRCKHYACLGVHWFCVGAADLNGRITNFDCAITGVKSESNPFVRCANCDTHLKPKTKRCSECLETKNLKNFKPDKMALQYWPDKYGMEENK